MATDLLTGGPPAAPDSPLGADPVLTGDPARLFRVMVVEHTTPPPRAADARRPGRRECVTFRLTAPRVILAEINTHRVLSKSSESSRAIPYANRIGQADRDPYRPLSLNRKGRGMAAGAALDDAGARLAASMWEYVRAAALYACRALDAAGLAKEEGNRLLEPFALCRTVLTGTDWANFFALRTHEAASPAFRYLARAMYVAYARSTPRPLNYGDWHLPFVGEADRAAALEYTGRQRFAGAVPDVGRHFRGPADYHLCRWSAARCARVSYGLLDGRPCTPAADDETWASLVGLRGRAHEAATLPPGRIGPGAAARWDADPVHASPAEHQGSPLHQAAEVVEPGLRSNLSGYLQFRRVLGGETVRAFDPPPEVVAEWAAAVPAEVFSDADIY